jgi:hypothetical protein
MESWVGKLKQTKNLLPRPYWCVSFQSFRGPLTEASIRERLLGREAYVSTAFIVFYNEVPEYAVVAVALEDAPQDYLFSRVTQVEVLSLPDSTHYVRDGTVDTTKKTRMAEVAKAHGVGKDQTLVVWGRFDHVSFFHHPDPLKVRIIELIPPEPPKLYGLAQQVLAYVEDLPAIELELETYHIRSLCEGVEAEAFLLPCRSAGLDDLPAPTYYLDDRPVERHNWVHIGCSPNLIFHRHFYGDTPPLIDYCPVNRAKKTTGTLTLVRCCRYGTQLSDPNALYMERIGDVLALPWSASTATVEEALKIISAGRT